MFVNFSNHSSNSWSKEQKETARKFGIIVDVSFPNVSASATSGEVMALAQKCAKEIMAKCVDMHNVVMCQGEFTLTYYVTSLLKSMGISVVVACSNRRVTETVDNNGKTTKTSEFTFVQFREV